MNTLWLILVQFIFRLTFGVAIAMGVTPRTLVTSGFYRVHLWVLMGLNTFASLTIYSNREGLAQKLDHWQLALVFAVVTAVASYAGSVVWLYERGGTGVIFVFAVALVALSAAALATPWSGVTTGWGIVMAVFDLISSGMLMGTTLAAMLLGHWYLNTPQMDLIPIKRLVVLMGTAIVVRTILCAAGAALLFVGDRSPDTTFLLWLLFRWLSGLLGTLAMAWMAWYTLKVPNTQSATGILYAAVILAFIGELASQLLSVDLLYPV